MNIQKLLFACLISSLIVNVSSPIAHAQEKVTVDRVIAVVGQSAILKSDLFNQQRQLESQGVTFGSNANCEMLDDLIYQKLLFNQAVIDSVEVSDDQVEQVLERRIRFFAQQIGSREQLEAYYGKTIEELKDEFRPLIKEQELSQTMQGQITRNVRVTPSEVRAYFNSLHPDSIPMVESEMELSHIVIKPEVAAEEKEETRQRLEVFRERILKGESFSTLAILYSEDPGSARKGGDLGFFGRGELFPEFEATAFGLRPGEISEVIETQAGFHIIQLIERRGELINTRHLLLRPKVSPVQIQEARSRLDSIRREINNDNISFEEAAAQFSDDASKSSGGIKVNPYTNTTRFRSEEVEPRLLFVVDRLEVGEISAPTPMMTEEGDEAFRIVKVRIRRDAQIANLDDNYDFIRQKALNKKKEKVAREWILSRLGNTHINIHEGYMDCQFNLPWLESVSGKK